MPIVSKELRGNKDLSGLRFGSYVVIGRGQRTAYWICQCDCGVRKDVAGSSLKRGMSLSCGCNVVANRRVLREDIRFGIRMPVESRSTTRIGQRSSLLTVIGKEFYARLGDEPERVVVCDCDCGETVAIRVLSIRSGQQSCGCHRREVMREHQKLGVECRRTHGQSGSLLYGTWARMISRCENPNLPQFELWGGRGISVCKEWRESFVEFREWALSVGYQEGLSLDRINTNRNYEPSNCQFLTRSEHARKTVAENQRSA